MKSITIIVLLNLILSTATFAQSDSVAVFHRKEKVLIQINEGYSGTTRLSDMMDFLGVGENFTASNSDQTIVLNCGRNNEAASCIFKFLPGSETHISGKKLEANTSLKKLNLNATGEFELYFESSMQDKFSIKIQNGLINFKASKKVL